MDIAKPKWQKVLYKDQNVADNYVDETFLEELRKNGNFFWAIKHDQSKVNFIAALFANLWLWNLLVWFS